MDTEEEIPKLFEPDAPRLSEDEFERSFKRLDTDYGYFASKMFNLKRQPKQELFGQAALEHDHTMGCFSRQTGKTFACAVLICKWLWLGDRGKPALIGAYAPKWDQAYKLMFMQVVEFMRYQDLIGDEIEKTNFADGSIRMQNGNEFQIFTGKDSAHTRGFRNTIVLIDEAQDITDDKRNTQIVPTGASETRWIAGEIHEGLELKIVETGTPKGRNHFFDNISKGRILEDASDLRALEEDDIAVVIQPWHESTTISMKAIRKAKRDFTQKQFEQEYECKFNFDTAFAFSWDDISATCTQKERDFQWEHDKFYVGGIDLGRTKDHTVISIFEWMGPSYDMVFHKQYDLNLQWYEILDDLKLILSYWKPLLTYFDATGPTGNSLYHKFWVDIIDSDLDIGNIKPFVYDPRTKVELIFNTQRLFERGWVRMFDEPQLVEQLRLLPEDRTSGDLPKFDKPKVGDDRVHSVALALKAGHDRFGDEGEKDGEGISFDGQVNKSLWSVLGKDAVVLNKKVDDGIAVGADTGLGSIFNRKDIWEGI